MPLNEDIVAASTRRLVRETERYRKLVRIMESECLRLVVGNGVHASVQARVKKPGSFRMKLMRYLLEENREKIDAIRSDEDVFRVVGDIGAVRIATYVEADTERVVRHIEALFGAVETERHSKSSGYHATHCQASLPPALAALEENVDIADLSCEIQVCSMLSHCWNEVEHDIRYKSHGVSGVDNYERSRLQSLRDVMKDGDGAIEELLMWRSARIAESLVEPAALKFPEARDFNSGAKHVLREAVRLGYLSLERLSDTLLTGNYPQDSISIIEALNARLEPAGEIAKSMNPQTSDVLLALLLRRHHADICGLHFKEIDAGSGDLSRIPFLANFVEEHALFE